MPMTTRRAISWASREGSTIQRSTRTAGRWQLSSHRRVPRSPASSFGPAGPAARYYREWLNAEQFTGSEARNAQVGHGMSPSQNAASRSHAGDELVTLS